MKAEIAVMTAENIDRDAIARGGEILKKAENEMSRHNSPH